MLNPWFGYKVTVLEAQSSAKDPSFDVRMSTYIPT